MLLVIFVPLSDLDLSEWPVGASAGPSESRSGSLVVPVSEPLARVLGGPGGAWAEMVSGERVNLADVTHEWEVRRGI